jgi:hypothetical protein
MATGVARAWGVLASRLGVSDARRSGSGPDHAGRPSPPPHDCRSPQWTAANRASRRLPARRRRGRCGHERWPVETPRLGAQPARQPRGRVPARIRALSRGCRVPEWARMGGFLGRAHQDVPRLRGRSATGASKDPPDPSECHDEGPPRWQRWVVIATSTFEARPCCTPHWTWRAGGSTCPTVTDRDARRGRVRHQPAAFGTLWRNPAVPDRLREEAIREIFERFDVERPTIRRWTWSSRRFLCPGRCRTTPAWGFRGSTSWPSRRQPRRA